MGAGKSTVLSLLQERGYKCIPEQARIVLSEQRSINGDGVPEKDPELFTKLMLEKMIFEFDRNADSSEAIIFDRGLPDLIAYADHFKIDRTSYLKTAEEYRYNLSVFMFPPWKEIYVNDNERKMSYELAGEFGVNVKKIYQELGYNAIDVSLIAADERARFISGSIKKIMQNRI